jgi:two-component system chemotaxis response regulator CheB
MGARRGGLDDGGRRTVTEEESEPASRRACLVALAASAGGVHALSVVLGDLPPDLAAPVVVVQHLAPRHPSHMAEILARQTDLHVKQARDGEALRRGVAYIAPPDRHLLVNRDATLTLAETELVHFVRPSADLLFESAAAAFGPGLLAVVLSGTGEDGAMGVRAVKKRGGTVVVQELSSAEFAGMPESAMRTGVVDRSLPLGEIGRAVTAFVGEIAA